MAVEMWSPVSRIEGLLQTKSKSSCRRDCPYRKGDRSNLKSIDIWRISLVVDSALSPRHRAFSQYWSMSERTCSRYWSRLVRALHGFWYWHRVRSAFLEGTTHQGVHELPQHSLVQYRIESLFQFCSWYAVHFGIVLLKPYCRSTHLTGVDYTPPQEINMR